MTTREKIFETLLAFGIGAVALAVAPVLTCIGIKWPIAGFIMVAIPVCWSTGYMVLHLWRDFP